MVTKVEFSDYQCPACKGLDTTVMRILASNRDRVALFTGTIRCHSTRMR